MATREMIRAELENVSEEDLDSLYEMVLRFTKHTETKPKLLERLSQIKIEGPPDFAENLDLYLNGEKCADPLR